MNLISNLDFKNNKEKSFYFAFVFFLLSQFFIPKDNIWDAVFYLLVIPTGVIYYWSLKNKSHWMNDPVFILIGLLLTWLLLSSLWSDNITIRIFLDIFRKYILTIFFVISCILFFELSISKIKFFIFSILVVASLSGMTSIVLHFMGRSVRLEPIGQLDHPVLGASVYGMVALFSLHYLLNENNRPKVFLALTSFMVSLVVVFLTLSRGPILAICISVLLYLYLSKNTQKIILYLFLIVMLAFSVAWVVDFQLFFDRLQIMVDRGSSHRLLIFQETINQLLHHPVFGYGQATPFNLPDLAKKFSHPHNLFLSTAYYGGMIALLILLAIISFIFLRVKNKAFNESRFFMMALFIYVMLSVVTDTAQLITAPDEMWMIFWFPLLMVSFYRKSLNMT